MIPTLIGVSVIVFFSIRLIPGDVVEAQMADSPYIDKARIDEIRSELGLNKPVLVQYGLWLKDTFSGNLGNSMISGRPTMTALGERIPVTLELAILATVISVLFALPLGIVSAVLRSSWIDYVARLIGIIGLSAPNFWVGTLLIVLPSIWFRWTPPISYVPITTDPLKNLQQFLFPSISLGLVLAATIMRMVRSSLLEVLRQDYIRVAQSKGLSWPTIIYRHALKNAIIPVITIIGLQFGFLLGGTIIVERIFALPGIGTLTLDTIVRRDYTQLQANILFIAFIFLAVNLVVDVLYAQINPRIRYT